MIEKNFNEIGYCSLCGSMMRHSRLYGYQCSNPHHAEILNEIYDAAGYDEDKIEELLAEKRKEMGYE